MLYLISYFSGQWICWSYRDGILWESVSGLTKLYHQPTLSYVGKAWKVFSYTVQTFWKSDGIFIMTISFCQGFIIFMVHCLKRSSTPFFSVCREPWRRLGVYLPKWPERMQREYVSSMSSNVAYNSSRFQTTGSSCTLYHVVFVWCLSII